MRYSPVVSEPGGRISVELAADHPGVTDPVYRARRDYLASLALGWKPGQPTPTPDYSEDESRVWQVVMAELDRLHDRQAADAFLEGKQALGLPGDRVPQLDEVTSRLNVLVGFKYLPVAGLAPLRQFYRSFADGTFWSTQYLRHPSVPTYTPEPDVIHEVVGHANQLATPALAELYRLMGRAVDRTAGDDALRFLSRVFWFTFEFGLVRQGSQIKAIGAGILSSVGEMMSFAGADIRRADVGAMGRVDYDITRYQPVLYCFDSMAHLEDEMTGFLSGFSDRTTADLSRKA